MRTTLCAIFVLMGCFAASAQSYLLKYDPACVQKLEYTSAGTTQGLTYVTFSVATSPTKRYFFDTGVPNTHLTSTLKGKVMSCADMSFSDEMMARINAGTATLSIVEAVSGGYQVSRVMLVTAMDMGQGMVTYRSPEGSFSVPRAELTGATVYSSEGSSSIFFYGGYYNWCEREVLSFTRNPMETCRPYEQLEIMPGVGVVSSRTGLTQDELDLNVTKLSRINGKPLEDFVCASQQSVNVVSEASAPSMVASEIASGEPVVTYSEVVTESSEPAVTTYNYRQNSYNSRSAVTENHSALTAKAAPAPAPEVLEAVCTLPQTVGTHVVMRGENLYRISKIYGITVEELRRWNQLQSDELSSCTRINIADPNKKETTAAAPATTKVPTDVPASYNLTTKSPTAAADKTVAKSPQPKPAPTTKPTKPAPTKAPAKTPAKAPAKTATADKTTPKGAPAEACPCKKTDTPAKTTKPTKPASTTVKAVPPADVPTSYGKTPATTPPKPADREWTKGGSCTYVVQPKETLYSIASKYGYTTDRLRYMNNLKESDVIKPGQVLTVCECDAPKTSDSQTKSPTQTVPATDVKKENQLPENFTNSTAVSTQPAPAGGSVHVVEDGETLATIAKRYNTTIDRIRRANDLKPGETVIPYQVLYIQ